MPSPESERERKYDKERGRWGEGERESEKEKERESEREREREREREKEKERENNKTLIDIAVPSVLLAFSRGWAALVESEQLLSAGTRRRNDVPIRSLCNCHRVVCCVHLPHGDSIRGNHFFFAFLATNFAAQVLT